MQLSKAIDSQNLTKTVDFSNNKELKESLKEILENIAVLTISNQTTEDAYLSLISFCLSKLSFICDYLLNL